MGRHVREERLPPRDREAAKLWSSNEGGWMGEGRERGSCQQQGDRPSLCGRARWDRAAGDLASASARPCRSVSRAESALVPIFRNVAGKGLKGGHGGGGRGVGSHHEAATPHGARSARARSTPTSASRRTQAPSRASRSTIACTHRERLSVQRAQALATSDAEGESIRCWLCRQLSQHCKHF